MPSLVEPTIAVRESFLAAMREFADEGRAGDDTMVGRDLVKWGDRWETDEGFAAYVGTVVRAREEDAPRDPGWVPCTTLWWVDGIAPTCAARRDGGGTPPRCSPPRCRWPPAWASIQRW